MTTLEKRYQELYGQNQKTQDAFNDLLKYIKSYKISRPENLKQLDSNTTWYMESNLIGMTLYVDLFASDFTHLIEKIDYFKELGITLIHLMPLLKPRPGENDGGYAVMDYTNVDPKLGDLKSFNALLEALRTAQIYVCIDYVINHVAIEHEWAQNALNGQIEFQDYFLMFDTDTIPNSYNHTVPEVLPDKAPGNFTYNHKLKKYIFTSFSEFQWDLNFANPYVFNGMVEYMLNLANMGVNMIRLDAIPFMWKTLGTSCRNLDQVHILMNMLHLIKDEVCPSVALLGEAIVEPVEIVKYFGTSKDTECDVMYNANLMVNIFNSFATRDVRLLSHDINTFHATAKGTWMNYVRCHDDIGWGFNENYLKTLGFDPFMHKQFLIDFYNGSFPNSFAKGENYQYNHQTKDARTNGTLASLLGLEKALNENDPFQRDIALKRIHLANALMLFYRGFPLIYSGDELATLNDQSYKLDTDKQAEGRWVHRPIFDWQKAQKRTTPYTDQYEVFQTLKELIVKRKEAKFLNGRIPQESIHLSNPNVLCIFREQGDEIAIGLFNFSEHPTQIDTHDFNCELKSRHFQDFIHGRKVDVCQKTLNLSAYEYLWLTPSK